MIESNGMAELKKFIYLIEATRPDGSKFTVFDDPKVIFLDILDAQYICNKWEQEHLIEGLKYQPVMYMRPDYC